MSKGMDKKKETKKEAKKSLKEKRAEKKAKRAGKNFWFFLVVVAQPTNKRNIRFSDLKNSFFLKTQF